MRSASSSSPAPTRAAQGDDARFPRKIMLDLFVRERTLDVIVLPMSEQHRRVVLPPFRHAWITCTSALWLHKPPIHRNLSPVLSSVSFPLAGHSQHEAIPPVSPRNAQPCVQVCRVQLAARSAQRAACVSVLVLCPHPHRKHSSGSDRGPSALAVMEESGGGTHAMPGCARAITGQER